MWAGIIVLAAAAAWIAWTFNALVALRNRRRAAWGDIDALLVRRADLVPNLVAAVRAYTDHEERTLERVTAARSAVLTAGDPDGPRAETENQLTRQLGRLIAVVEKYPELKASANVLVLQRELVDVEDDIASARRYHNAVVRDYNTRRESFPAMLVAEPLGFHSEAYFEIDDPAERDAPSVSNEDT